MVDSVYGRPRAAATRATPISPSGCIILVYPVGASASGRPADRPKIEVPVQTLETSLSRQGLNRRRRSAAWLAAREISASAAPSTYSNTGRGISRRAASRRSSIV